MDRLEIARQLDARRLPIVEYAVAQLMPDPFWTARFGDGIEERLRIDSDANLMALIKAIRYHSPMILDDHMVWRRNQIVGFGCSSGHVRVVFAHLWAGANQQLAADALPTIQEYMQSAMAAMNYSHPSARQIAAAQDALAEDLAAGTFDASWHWQAAYADEGRQQIFADCWFLVDYLVDAVGGGTPDHLARHVRWTRERIQRRGLTTTHVQQLLWVLMGALEQRLPPAALREARVALEAATASLTPASEACQALLSAQDAVVSDVAGQLMAHGLAGHPDQAAAEVGWYLAYLHDCLAAKSPALLVSYTRWMQHWLASQGLPDTPIRQCYAALGRSLERALPEYAAHEANAVLRVGLSGL